MAKNKKAKWDKKEIILNSQEIKLVTSALKAFEDEIIDSVEKERKNQKYCDPSWQQRVKDGLALDMREVNNELLLRIQELLNRMEKND